MNEQEKTAEQLKTDVLVRYASETAPVTEFESLLEALIAAVRSEQREKDGLICERFQRVTGDPRLGLWGFGYFWIKLKNNISPFIIERLDGPDREAVHTPEETYAYDEIEWWAGPIPLPPQ